MLGAMSARPPTVLLLSSNGAGMGHLTRLLAYSRRMPEQVQPYIVSLSQAVPVVEHYGLPWEYIPSQGATGLRPAQWRRLFADRVSELLTRVKPAVLVFDGTHPYAGLDVALSRFPKVRSVWSRRGMWKPGRNADQLDKSAWFDVVLEPGDLSHAGDVGATAHATGAVRVRPVTLVDRQDVSPRQEARSALGLPTHGQLALVSLGAGNINDTTSDIAAAIGQLSARGVGACVTSPAIADSAIAHASDVHVVSHFPLSEHFSAFDCAVAAAGYNSFHESLRLGLPTLFVPNTGTALDDQAARARHAAESGWALCADTLADDRSGSAVEELLARGPSLADAARRADPGNGAADAAQVIMDLLP